MAVFIPTMQLPKTCIECPLQFGGMCYVQPSEIDEPRVFPTIEECLKKEPYKPHWCPLIEIREDNPVSTIFNAMCRQVQKEDSAE